MGLVEKFRGKTVFLDTAPIIYFIEGHSVYQSLLFDVFRANDEGAFQFVTSSLTLIEVLVQPMRQGRDDLVEQYEQILSAAPNLKIIEMDVAAAKNAAQLRAEFNFKTPDAIQLAIGQAGKASFFLTNDLNLKRARGIDVVCLKDFLQ